MTNPSTKILLDNTMVTDNASTETHTLTQINHRSRMVSLSPPSPPNALVKAVSVLAVSGRDTSLDDGALRRAFESVTRRHAESFSAMRLTTSFTFTFSTTTTATTTTLTTTETETERETGTVSKTDLERHVEAWAHRCEEDSVGRGMFQLHLDKVKVKVKVEATGTGTGTGEGNEESKEEEVGVLLLTAPRESLGYHALYLLLREIKTVYESVTVDAEHVLPPLQFLPEQIITLLEDRRKPVEFGGEKAEEAEMKFWQQELRLPLPLVNIPTDKSAASLVGASSSGMGEDAQVIGLEPLEREDMEELMRFVAREQVSLEVVVLAAFKIVLHRYASQEDLVVACLVGLTQLLPGAEELPLGLEDFIPIQSTSEDHPSVHQYLQRIFHTLQRCKQNAMVGWQRILNEVVFREGSVQEPSPSSTGPRLTQDHAPAAFEYYDLGDVGLFDLGGVHFKRLGRPQLCASNRLRAGVKLVCVRTGTPPSLMLGIESQGSALHTKTIQRFGLHLRNVLKQMAKGGDLHVSDVDLMSQQERAQVLHGFNATARGYEWVDRGLCVHELVEEVAHRSPRSIALADAREHTYQELNESANRLANLLLQQHPGKLNIIPVVMRRGFNLVVAWLAVLKAGGSIVTVDPNWPLQRILAIIQDTAATSVLTECAVVDKLVEASDEATPLPNAVVYDREDWRNAIALAESSLRSIERGGDTLTALAHVLYTSGTTGEPKGVMITQSNLIHYVSWHCESYGLTQEDKVLWNAGLGFDAAMAEVWGTLVVGGQLCATPEDVGIVPKKLLDWVEANGVSFAFLTTQLAEMVIEEEKRYRRKHSTFPLRCIYTGGDRLHFGPRKRSPFALANIYGPTENTVASTMTFVPKGMATPPLIGAPVPNTSCYVLDAELRPCPIGVVGELYLSGAQLSPGYFQRPELNATSFVPCPFDDADEGRMYRTGDLARWREGGALEFFGRKDLQVKIRGCRVELSEIECCLLELFSVKEAVVLVRQTPRDKLLVAYCVGPKNSDASKAKLRQHLETKLPSFMIPTYFLILPRLPLTTNHKVDHRRLAQLELLHGDDDQAGQGEWRDARNPTEAVLVRVFSSVLCGDPNAKNVGAHFIKDLGANSLDAARITSKVCHEFKTNAITVSMLYKFPTIEAYSKALLTKLDQIQQARPPLPPQLDATTSDGRLSFNERSLWFYYATDNHRASTAYNVSFSGKVVSEALDISKLREALVSVMSQHDVLRTRYVSSSDASMPVKREVVDVSELGAFLWEVERIDLPVKEWMTRERYKPFDITTAPLLRMWVLNLDAPEGAAKEQYLLIVLPHIITDLWSFLLLLEDLFTQYTHAAQRPLHREAALPYALFATRQHADSALTTRAESLRRRMETLHMDPDAFPYDFRRPKTPGFRGAAHQVEVSSDLRSRLEKLCRQLGVTLNTALFMVYFVLIWQHTGTEQVVLGTPMAGRTQPDVERTLGYFVNPLPIGLDMAGNPTFLQLVKRLNAVLVEAMDYDSVPLSCLDAEGLSKESPFRLVFAMQEAREAKEGWDGLVEQFLGFDKVKMGLGAVEMDSIVPYHQHSQFDLVLMCCTRRANASILASFQYDTDLFRSDTVHRLAQRWVNIIRCVLDRPHTKLAEIPSMVHSERNQLLSTFNDTARAYPRSTIHALIVAQAAAYPQRPAFSTGTSIMTYEELDVQANKLAKFLLLTGLKHGSIVPVLLKRSAMLLVAWLAVLKAGAAVVSLDESLPRVRVEGILGQTGATHVVTEQGLVERVQVYTTARCIVLDDDGLNANAIALLEPTAPAGQEASDEALAFVVFTSGSTGEPKGVMLEHRSVVNYIQWHVEDYALAPEDRVMSNACLSFDAAMGEILPTLAAGACVLPVHDKDTALIPFHLLDWMEQAMITVAFLTTQLAEMLLDEDRRDPRDPRMLKLRLLFTGGERLHKRPRAGAAYKLVNIYGPTECTVNVTKAVVDAGVDRAAGLPLIGAPVANTKCYVLDKQLLPLPIGVCGELYVSGVQLARGYLNQPKLTAERFIANPFKAESGEGYTRLYRTGDIVRWHEPGVLEFRRRADSQLKVRGFRVEPAEIEHALLQVEGVREAVCVSVTLGELRNMILVVYFTYNTTATTDTTPSIDALKAHMRQHLPGYMRPAFYVPLASLPLTPNHKVDRAKLPPPDSAALSVTARAEEVGIMTRETPTLTKLQTRLQVLWRKVLGVTPTAVFDTSTDFFEMGGNSLAAARLIAVLKEEFNVTLSLAGFLQNPTVHGLEILIQRQQGVRLDASISTSSSTASSTIASALNVDRSEANSNVIRERRRHSLKALKAALNDGKQGSSIDTARFSSSLRRTRLFESASISSGKLSKYGKLKLNEDSEGRKPLPMGNRLARAIVQYQDMHSKEDIAHSPSWLDGHSLRRRVEAAAPSTVTFTTRSLPVTGARALSSRPKAEVSVLSYNQQSLWFLHNMDEKNVEYVVYIAAVLPPTTNLDAVLCALQLLVDAHPSLRTTYDQTNGSPYQVVHPPKRYTDGQEDYSQKSPSTLHYERWTREVSSREEVVRKVENEIHKPWDLAAAPPFRATVIPHAANVLPGPVLVVTAHHIAMDGFSVDILWRELEEEAYPHAVRLVEQGRISRSEWGRGWASRVVERETVAGYARRQKERLEGEDGQVMWKFWQRTLANYDSIITLPGDFTRPRRKRVQLNGAWHHFHLDLTQALRTEMKQSGVTLFMLLLATFSTLVHKYTGKRDVLVGSPMACRDDVRLNRTVGNITNLVALRVMVDPSATLRALLQHARSVVVSAYDNQSFPFSVLVERLASYRDPSVPPLIQVMLSLNQRFQPSESKSKSSGILGGLRSLRGVEQRVSPFDMQWIVNEDAGGSGRLACSIQYRNDLFTAQTMANMATHLSTLFHAFGSSASTTPIQDVDYLSTQEHNTLLTEWSNRLRCNPAWNASQCAHQLFEAMAEQRPLATAVTMAGQDAWTYGELNARANILAHYLRHVAKAGPGARVAILLPRTPLLALAMLAVPKAGCAYVPLDPNFPTKRVDYILADAAVDVLLCIRNPGSIQLPRPDVFVVELNGDGWAQVVDSMQQRLPGACLGNPSPPLAHSWTDDNKQWHGARSLVYVVYTSGSTGNPKGVQVDHRALVHLAKWHVAEYDVSFKDRASQIVGAAFDPVGLELWPFFAVGASVHFVPERLKKDVKALSEWLDAWRISIALLPTPLAEVFLKTCKRTDKYPKSLRVMYTGGDKLNIPIGLHTPFRLDNHYGPAEATIMSTYYTIPTTTTVNEPIVDPVRQDAKGTPSFCPWIGRPIADCEVYVVDPSLRPVPCMVPGELLIGGVGLGLGYLNRPDLTKTKWIPSSSLPFTPGPRSERVYRTGDLVRWRHDGNLEFIGRADSQVKIRGVRIELSEIKSVLQQHADMLEVCVLAREDHPGRKRICAYVVLLCSEDFDKTVKVHQLRSHVKDRLPEYMIPVDWIFLESLPKTSNGKINKTALPMPTEETRLLGESATSKLVEPRTADEVIMLGLWKDALALESISIHDNFFDLGGHSLAVAQLLSTVHDSFGVHLTIDAFFQDPTISGTARAVAKLTKRKRKTSIDRQSSLSEDSNGVDVPLPEHIKQDCQLNPGITIDITANMPKDPFACVFVTGVTGFLGAFLLKHFLCDSPTTKRVHCLVRAESDASALQRLVEALEHYELLEACKRSDVKLCTYAGDLMVNRFGFSDQHFVNVAETVTTVFHCGAWVHSVYPYEKLRDANVYGTENAIALASIGPALLFHVSTLSVHSPYNPHTRIKEDAPLKYFHGLEGGYAQTKWVAEKLVKDAGREGLPTIVFRPGRITGDSKSGVGNLDDLMSKFLKGCIQLRAAPDLDWSFDINPVDCVVDTIVAIAQDRTSIGKTFHLCSKDPPSLKAYFQLITELGYTCSILPYATWRARLINVLKQQKPIPREGNGSTVNEEEMHQCDNELLPLLHMFVEDKDELEVGNHLVFDMTNTEAAWAHAGYRIDLPPLLHETYFDFLIKREYIPPPMSDGELSFFPLEDEGLH